MLITSARKRKSEYSYSSFIFILVLFLLLVLFCLALLGALQGSTLCSLFFLIYIKSNHTVSAVKQLAADDILFFMAILSRIKSRFKSKSKWKFIRMSFNPDHNYAQKVIFS